MAKTITRADRLKKLRGDTTQAELAYKTKIGQATICRIELGHSCRSVTLRKLEKFFKLKTGALDE